MTRYRLGLALWLLSDLLLFLGSYGAAYFLRVGFLFSTDFPFDRFFFSALAASPIWLLVLATTRTFHLSRTQASLRNLAYIAYAALVGIAFFTLAYYFRYTAFFSRLLLIEAFVLSTVIVWLWHMLFGYLFRMLLRRSPPAFPTLIVGVTRESRALIDRLNARRNPLAPVAVIDAQGIKETSVGGVPYVGRLNKLEETFDRFRITHVIQASDMEQSLNLLSACRNRGIHFILLPSVLGIIGRDERVETLEGHPVTVVPAKETLWSRFFR